MQSSIQYTTLTTSQPCRKRSRPPSHAMPAVQMADEAVPAGGAVVVMCVCVCLGGGGGVTLLRPPHSAWPCWSRLSCGAASLG
jgi:hypothetical protein